MLLSAELLPELSTELPLPELLPAALEPESWVLVPAMLSELLSFLSLLVQAVAMHT